MDEQNLAALEEFAKSRGLSVEEIQRHLNRVSAHSEANAEPLPGPLALAFPARSINIHGLRVRPFVAYDRVLLRALDSPVHRQLLELGKPVEERAPTAFTEHEGYEIVWMFTHSCEECAKILGMDLFDPLGAEGVTPETRKEFRKLCVREIGLKMCATVVALAISAIGEQIGRSISTALQYAGAREQDEGALFYSATTGADDGLSWWLSYTGRLLRYYPQISERRVYYELPMITGFAYLMAAIEEDPNFTGERSSPGYIAQEIERRKTMKNRC